MPVEVPLTDAEDESRKVVVGLGKLVTVEVIDEEVECEDEFVKVALFVADLEGLSIKLCVGVTTTVMDLVDNSDEVLL